MKPENPFRKGSMCWALMEEDWSDLTVKQVAEVFGVGTGTVEAALTRIRRKTGYEVPLVRTRKGKKAE